jgi:acetyl-CoA carboxylase biotin carboxyl carrier protein
MSDQSMLITRVQALIEALEQSSVGEIELTEGGTRIKITRASAVTPTVLAPPPGSISAFPAMPFSSMLGAPGTAAPASHAAPAGRPKAARPAADAGVPVVSPLTGVYYSASSPTTDPFVNIGDAVQAGQVVAIVEAMKVFNEVKSEVAGTVIAMPAKNGQLVQKGDPLVRIQPI